MRRFIARVAFAFAVAVALFGCDEVRVEPKAIPNFVPSYKVPELHARLAGLPVRLNLDECVSKAVLSWRTMTGGYDREMPFVFRKIVEREFRRALADNFTDVSASGQRPLVELKILPNLVNITGESDKVNADVTFSVKLLHPTDVSVRPYFSRDYPQHASCKDLDDAVIPACVYESIQRMVLHLVRDLGADRLLIKDLEALISEDALELSNLKLVTTEGGEQCRGSVSVDCKDFSREQALAWACEQIDRQCQEALRARRGSYWVFYATRTYDEGARRWFFAFDAALSGDFIVIRDSARRGRCFADFGNAEVDRKSAPRVMRRKLIDYFRGKEKRSVEVEIEDVRDDADNKGVLSARYRLLD